MYLTCIKTQQRATSPFDDTPVISSINHQNTALYQGSANCCEGYHYADLIRLIQQSLVIH